VTISGCSSRNTMFSMKVVPCFVPAKLPMAFFFLFLFFLEQYRGTRESYTGGSFTLLILKEERMGELTRLANMHFLSKGGGSLKLHVCNASKH
jgi:hypothetical protein